MKSKFLFSIAFLLLFSNVFSQTNLNNYKYVIVPNKFDFLKDKDQYQLNSLAQFLFGKYGFTALKEGEDYPQDLRSNRCLALRSDVLKESGMFKTRLKVELKDCNDQVIYTTGLGESREKEFKKAYNQSIREAFLFIRDLNYSYVPNESITSLATTTITSTSQPAAKREVSQEIQELKEEIEILKKAKLAAAKQDLIVKPKPVAELEPEIPPKTEIETAKPIVAKPTSNILYAQEISGGFQLVDSSPKVVYKIKSTGLDNVYLVEGKSAIIYKKGSAWVIEYYTNGVLKKETLNIKF
ncbi:hypothetical protein [Seonamhaeicola maritimus]|uniref:Uncharacterized protein n=1 Tax=Seonamhaeicola maritimus TaxID=2591822 RepID=A0A5C7GKZ3_9FLAO|nr:hypothetical protein [Seonamhaeicola maritimus]TXG38787.1 hypothetical protein FUA22_02565 [Seonamhaeicola maritimus]